MRSEIMSEIESLSPPDDSQRAEDSLRTYLSARVLELAAAQLEAYNRASLDEFCACYSAEVIATREESELLCEGIKAFRERYRPMFERGGFGASVTERRLEEPSLYEGGLMSVSCVDSERWWRMNEGERSEGEVWVRYHLSFNEDRFRRLRTGEAEAPTIERVEFSSRPLN
jgi:hypothetical protein